jgi:deoxycytidylate deaminase
LVSFISSKGFCLNKRDYKFFEIAKKLSYKSTSHFKLGCCIANKNKLINVGYNDMKKTHPKSTTYDNYIHAELSALIGCSFKETRGATVYLYRETKDQKLATSRSCSHCYQLLKLAGIKKLAYSTPSGFKIEKIN